MIQSGFLFESPEEIWLRVFRDLKPRTAPPRFAIEFRRYANPDTRAVMSDGVITVRMSDLLEGAPPRIIEALAYMLLGKLFRKQVSAVYSHRYRTYLNRKEVRRSIHLVRQIRGRKFISGPEGERHNLEEIFERLNATYFGGLMARPQLGWSRKGSRITLGHFDPSHNAIILSKLLDGPKIPPVVVEYVMYHEMLHLKFPTIHEGSRRRIHTADFRQAEKTYPHLAQAREWLKTHL